MQCEHRTIPSAQYLDRYRIHGLMLCKVPLDTAKRIRLLLDGVQYDPRWHNISETDIIHCSSQRLTRLVSKAILVDPIIRICALWGRLK